MEADQKTIEEMYRKMETDGCDTAIPLKWGFSFLVKNPRRKRRGINDNGQADKSASSRLISPRLKPVEQASSLLKGRLIHPRRKQRGILSHSRKKENNLKDIYSELIDHDYITETVHQNDEGDWVLQVSKIEVLPSAKLYRRCLAFNDLAETYDSFYDGWDVGKIN